MPSYLIEAEVAGKINTYEIDETGFMSNVTGKLHTKVGSGYQDIKRAKNLIEYYMRGRIIEIMEIK